MIVSILSGTTDFSWALESALEHYEVFRFFLKFFFLVFSNL